MAEQKFELVLKMSETGVVSNAKELAVMLPEKLKKFNYVVDEGNVDNATSDRTKLNALEKKFKEARKQFEDVELNEWYTAKKIIMDDIEKEIKKVSDKLKEGIDSISEKEKISKMEEARVHFNGLELPIDVEFEKVYDRKKYDVKAMTVKKILEDIQIKVDKIDQDVELMKLFLPTDEVEAEQVKKIYSNTLDLSCAKAKADELVELHEKVDTSKRMVETSQECVAPVIENVDNKQEIEVEHETELFTRTFQVNTTREQIINLTNYMNEQGIKFKKIEM